VNRSIGRRAGVLLLLLMPASTAAAKEEKPLGPVVTREGRVWRWAVDRPAGATRERFEAANRKFAYAPRPAPRDDAPWTGTKDAKGQLRLVATGPGVFRVAVLELR